MSPVRVVMLLSIAVVVLCQDPCGTARVQSIVDSFITTCMQTDASQVDWRGNCSELETSAWQRGCEWGNRYAAVYFMNSLLPNCDASSTDPIVINTTLSSVPQDICTHSAAVSKACISTNNITTISPLPRESTISCGCLEAHRIAIFECPFLLGLSQEVAPPSTYYSFADIRNKCSPSCDLDSVSVDETNNTDVYALTVTVAGEKAQAKNAFRTVISTSVGFEVSPSQIYILYWDDTEAESSGRYEVNFFLMNVPVARVTAVVNSLNDTIADPNSILRQQLDATPHFLVEANTPQPSPSPPFILKDEEVPTSMIAVTAVLGVLLFFAIVGYLLVTFMSSEDDSGEHEAKDEDANDEEEDEEDPDTGKDGEAANGA